MRKLLFIPIIVLLLIIGGCQKEINNELSPNDRYTLKFTFNNKVGAETMQLNNTYQNPFNEAYTLTMFKYYISNIMLQQDDGTAVMVADNYHLIDEAVPGSKTLEVSLNSNKFNKFSFLIGVDSARNVSGTQSGDLDPVKGMFWTWNSGYIMAKLEANSPASPAPAQKVEIHVGGFKTGENSLRRVSFDLETGSTIDIKENGITELVIDADANTWFKSLHDMKIADFPVSGSPGDIAMKYADNYAKMFTLTAVKN